MVESWVYKVSRRLLAYPMAWAWRRLNLQTIFIGVTGSAGKTTTKDLCQTVLSRFGSCISNSGTDNDRIHVAALVLRTRRQDRYCVVELSGGEPGAMDLRLRLSRPQIGVLTTIGRDHYSAFKSVEGIADEKAKLIRGLPSSGVAVLNIDDPLVKRIGEASRCRKVWVGWAQDATVRLTNVSSRWPAPLTLQVEYDGSSYTVVTGLHGEHQSLAVISTLGVAVAAGVDFEDAIAALANAVPAEGRMQVVAHEDGVVFVRDDWKSPHWSIDLPLRFIKNAEARRKIIVIGTVSDSSLGPSKRYPKIAQQARQVADQVLLVGTQAAKALDALNELRDETIRAFPEVRDAAEYLDTILQPGDIVLLKGTNLQDHLARLELNRHIDIGCWRMDCRLNDFCGHCSRLRQVVRS
ncbi:Mur ligase family protein [Kineobactrum sediminis]|nr:Mur ligase family protein [Kineobactrum sediminis]